MSEFTSQWQRSSSGHKDTMDSPPGTLGLSLEAQELRQPMVWLCMPTTREGISQGSRGKASGKHHVTKRPSHPVWSHNRNWKTTSHHIPACVPWSYHPHQAAWRRDEAAGSTLAQKRVICSCWVCPNLCDRTPSRRQHQSKQGMRLERGKWQESRSQHHAGAAACCQAQRLLQGLSRIWWTQQGGQG